MTNIQNGSNTQNAYRDDERPTLFTPRNIILGTGAAIAGAVVGNNVLKARAAREAARKAAAMPLHKKIIDGISHIASPKSGGTGVALIGGAAAAFYYRDKLGSALSNITGVLKNIPGKIRSMLPGGTPAVPAAPAPINAFATRAEQYMDSARGGVGRLSTMATNVIDGAKDLANKLNPIKGFLSS